MEAFCSNALPKNNMETYNTVTPRGKNYEKNQVYVVAKGGFVVTMLIIRKLR